jgi:hypothetical protein
MLHLILHRSLILFSFQYFCIQKHKRKFLTTNLMRNVILFFSLDKLVNLLQCFAYSSSKKGVKEKVCKKLMNSCLQKNFRLLFIILKKKIKGKKSLNKCLFLFFFNKFNIINILVLNLFISEIRVKHG